MEIIVFKSLLGIAPQKESDGSYKPSKVALMLATSKVTDFGPQKEPQYKGKQKKVVVLFTEQKNMTMKNGLQFSTGNHPIESLLPILHLKNAGFEVVITTPTGKPVVFEMWAMPVQDKAVLDIYNDLSSTFQEPTPLTEVLDKLRDDSSSFAAVFVPGGHGVMLGIPEDKNVGTLLRLAHQKGMFTISICHGPGSFLATTIDGNEFLYKGYEMAVFPDAMDKKTPMIGYLPGHMPWLVEDRLSSLGAKIVNKKADKTCCVDRKLITGASPLASNELGKLSVKTLLEQLD